MKRKTEQTIMSDLTIEQKKTIVVCETIFQVVEESGSVPSGHIYAALMGSVDIDTYNAAVGLLVKIGKIRNSGHLLSIV